MMSANGVDTTVDPTAQLFADYVYLDSSERKRFSQSSHELLITCLQHTGAETVAPGASAKTNNIRLNLNHPVRSLSWVLKGAQHGGYTVGPRGTTNDRWAPLASAKLQLNGHDRFDERKGSYFNQVQPFQTTGCSPAAGIYNYSFALKPQEIVQPSGSCNFSRIDNSTLVLTTKAGSVATTGDALANVLDENTTVANIDGNLTSALIFAKSYNVLRVLSGMGGVRLFFFVCLLVSLTFERSTLTHSPHPFPPAVGVLFVIEQRTQPSRLEMPTPALPAPVCVGNRLSLPGSQHCVKTSKTKKIGLRATRSSVRSAGF